MDNIHITTETHLYVDKRLFAKRFNQVLDERKYPPKQYGRYREVANDFGVTDTTTRNWLIGRTLPKPAMIQEIAQYYGVSLNWLVFNKGNIDDK